ncbi:MAG TPA: prolyl oligopeptidase family serine peptidase [Armatimonadota bacterium]|jgi:dienelactone hydrolase
MRYLVSLPLLCVAFGPTGAAAAKPAPVATIQAGPVLAIPSAGGGGSPLAPWDAVRAELLRHPGYEPQADGELTLPDGRKVRWTPLTISKDGWYNNDALRGGYAYTFVTSSARTLAILDASAHSMVYVNGEPRIGDVYKAEIVKLPIVLRAGRNNFFLRSGRGFLRFGVKPCAPSVTLDTSDATLPDLRLGEPAHTQGALVLVNATERALAGLSIEATAPGGKSHRLPVPLVGALSVRKIPFPIAAPAAKRLGDATVKVRLLRGAAVLARSVVHLRVRRTDQTYKRTFISGIDGSVQYFAVNPVQPSRGARTAAALILSLHGASVEAIGNVDAYRGKTWTSIVSPTNRRPYGFDWEDWGRLDALEVLAEARRELHPDPRRIYLTGHSMGGHGTWQIGALFPGLFAAIGPCSAWESAYTYAGGSRKENASSVDDILQRANAAMDTESLAPNYADEGVYILHGDADETVPVTEARHMAQLLSGFHKDYQLHEQKGAGHWWESSDEPGAECMDWPPLFDFLARHTIPTNDAVRQVRFVTPNPGVTASYRWATIDQQERALQLSKIDIQVDPGQRRFIGTTSNVERLALDLSMLPSGGSIHVALDGRTLDSRWPATGVLRLAKAGGNWKVAGPLPATQKNPLRNGPFRDAFRNRMVFVYGTAGTKEENVWAFAKARFDAETFWYRGNGAIDVVPDSAFSTAAYRDRGVILYGNADTNAAWKALLSDSPIQVTRRGVSIGGRHIAGEDLACAFVRPRKDSSLACVAVVAPVGGAGRALADGMAYLQPMNGFPDAVVASLGKGVVAAGFFGNDWSLASGDFAWAEDKAPAR